MAGRIARALVYSGRPDPTWKVDEDLVRRLEIIWERLAPFAGAVPSPPPLGYRGCSMLNDPEGEFVAYGGVVTKRANTRTDSREDVSRQFERLLLSSAPDDLLPDGLGRFSFE